MENKKYSILKIVLSAILSAAILGMFVYVCIKGDIEHSILSLSCIGGCVLLALIFIRLTSQKVLLTLALAAMASTNFLTVFLESADILSIVAYVMCGVQAVFLVYTMFLFRGNGPRVITLAIRVGLCLLFYFLVPNYVVLDTLQIIHGMIVINALVTLGILLFKIKTQWLAFLAMLLLFLFSLCTAFNVGWAIALNLPAEFLNILTAPFLGVHNLAFLFYIPGALLLALASVWERKSE